MCGRTIFGTGNAADGPRCRPARATSAGSSHAVRAARGSCTHGVRVEAPTRWGTSHQAVARAGTTWLTDVIAHLERCPELRPRLPVVANSTLTVRDDQLIVPLQPGKRSDGQVGPVEVALPHSAPVNAAIEGARSPVRVEVLSAQLNAAFPKVSAAAVMAMLAELIEQGALITSLHAPSTEPDALAYLLLQLDEVGAAMVPPVANVIQVLQEVHAGLRRHNTGKPANARATRRLVSSRMRSLALSEHDPLAVDLRLDATVTLSDQVAREVERATLVLARLSPHPYGTVAWRTYHQRFRGRYGIGPLVPLQDVVDPDRGIGFPDGYPGTASEPRSPTSRRDDALLAVAERVALDGADEVVLDEALIEHLELGVPRLNLPPHLEASINVRATDEAALERGNFKIEVVALAQAGGLTGRSLGVLRPADVGRLAAGLAKRPASDRNIVLAQMSFPQLEPATAHVVGAVQVLPTVISLAEHRWPQRSVLTVDDLTVGCDGQSMYLAAPEWEHRIEAVGMHELRLNTYTPALARFIVELGRAQFAQVTAFDWGAVARAKLPFLPRVRYGRAILAPATWRLQAAELPDRRQPWCHWDDALDDWRTRRRMPRMVYLAEADQRLSLDLDEWVHRVLLRTHLLTTPRAVLVERPTLEDLGWCGSRQHNLIVALQARGQCPDRQACTAARLHVVRDSPHVWRIVGFRIITSATAIQIVLLDMSVISCHGPLRAATARLPEAIRRTEPRKLPMGSGR
ncbi:lantibiotic dehydratase family protein [Micromonospora sp. M12]